MPGRKTGETSLPFEQPVLKRARMQVIGPARKPVQAYHLYATPSWRVNKLTPLFMKLREANKRKSERSRSTVVSTNQYEKSGVLTKPVVSKNEIRAAQISSKSSEPFADPIQEPLKDM